MTGEESCTLVGLLFPLCSDTRR